MHHCMAKARPIDVDGYFLLITNYIIMLLTYKSVMLEIEKDDDVGIELN